jgi:AcrR family transcriptional regulator
MARERARRIPLNRERVLHAATSLADERGIESLSMRRLAEELGVKAMSLYNHVANKDDVLSGIVDAAWGEIEMPAGDGDWKAGIRTLAVSAHETMLRHPWASGFHLRTKPGPARIRYGESLLGCFRNGGFSKDVTYHAYHIVESYVTGYTFQVLSYRAMDTRQFDEMAGRFLRGELSREYPYFTEHALQHLEPGVAHDDVSAYELGLDLILDGLEKLRDEG